MEYFINVYVLMNKQSTIFTDAFYDRKNAVEDVKLEDPRNDIRYIHTIRVEDKESVVCDLRWE